MGTLDALVYVARSHGIDTSADALSRRFVVQPGAMTGAALVALAGEIGLRARILKGVGRSAALRQCPAGYSQAR